MSTKYIPAAILPFLICFIISCKKEKAPPNASTQAVIRIVSYNVKGSNIRVNFIDSNTVFQKDKTYHGSFDYTFRKGSGAPIGISVFKQTALDTIYSWTLTIDGKLYANAFSEGGAYLSVPFK